MSDSHLGNRRNLLQLLWFFLSKKLGLRKVGGIFLAASVGYVLVTNSLKLQERIYLAANSLNKFPATIYQTIYNKIEDTGYGLKASTPAAPANKIILYWTKYYDLKDMLIGFGRELFIKSGCSVTNCWATDDRSFLNESDAVIFHSIQMNMSDLPLHRLPHQRYVYMLYETLPLSRHALFFSRAVDNYFNWTMTHRRDSDIYMPQSYDVMRRRADSLCQARLPPPLAPGEQIALPEELMTPFVQNHSRLVNRTKLLAWFCTNRKTHGKRENYVDELAKHMAIDVYGGCGNLTCLPRNSLTCNSLLDKYKFYLSAENSLCPDYVSEKFYRALKSSVVPVVYGGADYAAYAPPHSYIHVADFRAPKELADYLKLLDKNDALYLKYFEWKKDYEVSSLPMDGVCELCKKLNDPDEPVKIYESLERYWFNKVPCFSGDLFLSGVLNSSSTLGI